MKYKKHITTTLYVITLFFLLVIIAVPTFVASMFLGERIYQPQHNSADYGIESHPITLTTDDNLALAAWRTFSAVEATHGTVIIVSGLQAPSVTAFFGYANMLAQNGWDSLLIEKRARSLSEGREIGFGTTEWLDIKAGMDFLDNDPRAGDLPIIALGTSAGGAAAIIAGGEIPRLDGIIAISAYSNFIDLYIDLLPTFNIPRFVGIASTPFMHLNMGFRLGFDTARNTPVRGIARLGQRPILLMHSTEDWQVPFSHFETLRQAAAENNIALTTFLREGDWHFVCYDAFVSYPSRDIEFSQAIIEFLTQFIS
ncbi:MAG: alpha/beta hydrolase [Defluviitaleaceae bacterium]|nr:alpha/beta hydrolase [Defluviitaleaceae bacterium]